MGCVGCVGPAKEMIHSAAVYILTPTWPTNLNDESYLETNLSSDELRILAFCH